MDAHEIEIAMRNGDESWCACTCGWTTDKLPELEAAKQWAAHVVEVELSGANRTAI